jgi:hypothetical protein
VALMVISAAYAQTLPATSLSEAESRALELARGHELRGRESDAFEFYRTFAKFDRDAIDVHLHFAGMARARLGLVQSRALFLEMGRDLRNPAMKLATAMLVDRSIRRRSLEAFVEAYPNYGPALMLVAEEYRLGTLESQSLRDRLRERELLSRFLEFDAQGKLAASFIDSTVLAGWLDRAERRLAELDAGLDNSAAAPTALYSRSNSSWTVHLNMPETVSEVSYRIGVDGVFQTTGFSGAVEPKTGRRMVNTYFSMSLETPAATIYVKYRDVAGTEAGPFAITFAPHDILLARDRETLAGELPGWVYFNTVVETRCVIKSAEYGFNGPPNQRFALSPCDMRDPWRTPENQQSAVKMTPDVRLVSVRLTFTDGRVETRTYRRPDTR